MTKCARILVYLLLAAIIASCAPNTPEPKPVSQPLIVQQPAPTQLPSPAPLSLYLAPELPDMLVSTSEHWGIPFMYDPGRANLHLELTSTGGESTIASRTTWIYALVAPFPTVTDGVTFEELKAVWSASSTGPFAGSPLWMADSTLAAFSALWGEPAPGSVQTVPVDELVNILWDNQPSWGIIPFEELGTKLKVLSVDGQSPIHKNFNADE